MAVGPGGESSRLLVDGHVHLHRCFEPGRLIVAALTPLGRGPAPAGTPFGAVCLLLATTSGEPEPEAFLSAGAAGAGPAAELTRHCDGSWSVLRPRPGGRDERLLVVPGRQVVTAEGLELLAVGEGDRPEDGVPVEEGIGQVLSSGGVPVLPWGFGKWWLGRGRLVARILDDAPAGLFLGDNAGRPRGMRSSLLARAVSGGVPVLPGSDPLPLRWHATRAASYGFVLDDPGESATPGRALVASLRALRGQPPTFGRRSSVPAFVRDQAALRLSRGR